MKNDRTLQAIGRQLKAMGCERFDIGVRDATTGQMMNREWSAAEVLQNTPWLKRMNAQGNDVYIRPAEQERHGLVLVDDLSEFDLDDMKAEGREPALVVETSPKNYQAWVKVADAAGGELRGQIARTLASETARLLHQRLCGWIDPGKTGKASIDTLCGYVWPSEASGSTMRKRRQRVREALPELVALGWTVTEFAAGKYDITRPKAAG